MKIKKLKKSSKIKEKDLEGDDWVNSNPLYSSEDFELRNKDNN